ncbi:DUF2000 domain-containing protein [Desulfovibrio ferrophilus]|uniref:DUF2000 domain-containing protein n=1 Tax=Desulfovibrio ferrophilus TaxID=241368 RepID=A0A2Z6AUL6_9BACT|nr:DUF2000 domain-containing protein [Desulfovibrio ferrophilus]BBD06918.1 uncharacterized protein DFE_0192 [Desulfovibrio ferrophilus]
MAVITNPKCVIIIDPELPLGLIANTAAVLSLSLGRKAPHVVGPPVVDASGVVHEGITGVPIPVLKSQRDALRGLSTQARESGLYVVGFTRAAQTSRRYDEYEVKMSAVSSEEQCYLGLALYGESKSVSRLTGNLGLLR